MNFLTDMSIQPIEELHKKLKNPKTMPKNSSNTLNYTTKGCTLVENGNSELKDELCEKCRKHLQQGTS